MNSVIVVLIMATIVALILIRTVRRDLAKYEQLVVDTNSLDMKDEAGWKLVSGDAFRTPANSRWLAVQVIICSTTTAYDCIQCNHSLLPLSV
jgi:transmembrane 9 superfamily protein 2/4